MSTQTNLPPTRTRLTLDICKTVSQASVSVVQGDATRRLIIHLTEDGVLYPVPAGAIALLTGERMVDDTGVPICEDCVIYPESGAVTCDLSAGTTFFPGTFEVQLSVLDQDDVSLVAPWFTLTIRENRFPASLTQTTAFDEFRTLVSTFRQDAEDVMHAAEQALEGAEEAATNAVEAAEAAGAAREVDPTLTKEDVAADAKVVGNMVENIVNGKLPLESGTIDAGGNSMDNTKRVRSSRFTKYNKNSRMKISFNSHAGIELYLYRYKLSGVFMDYYILNDWLANGIVIALPQDYLFKFVARKTTETEVAPADVDIKIEVLKDIDYEKTVVFGNYLDMANVTYDMSFSHETGNLVQSNGYFTTDMVKIPDFCKDMTYKYLNACVTANGKWGRTLNSSCAFFDKNYEFLHGYNGTNYAVEIPVNARYVRVSFKAKTGGTT